MYKVTIKFYDTEDGWCRVRETECDSEEQADEYARPYYARSAVKQITIMKVE